jgi:DNA-binding PadR family transcriptional regulator
LIRATFTVCLVATFGIVLRMFVVCDIFLDTAGDRMADARTNTKGWMRGASAPLRGALLGIVLERPGHGGDLASRLVARLGATWRIDTNDVYRLLDQLVTDGLVVAREEPRRDNARRTRVIYRPTELTEGALTEWMETMLPREPVRLGLHAKLAVARDADAGRVVAALRDYERECLRLAQLVAPPAAEMRSWTGLVMDCTRDAVRRQLQADIDWAAQTRQRINERVGARER